MHPRGAIEIQVPMALVRSEKKSDFSGLKWFSQPAADQGPSFPVPFSSKDRAEHNNLESKLVVGAVGGDCPLDRHGPR